MLNRAIQDRGTWEPEGRTHQRRGQKGSQERATTRLGRFLLAKPRTCTDYTGGQRKGEGREEELEKC